MSTRNDLRTPYPFHHPEPSKRAVMPPPDIELHRQPYGARFLDLLLYAFCMFVLGDGPSNCVRGAAGSCVNHRHLKQKPRGLLPPGLSYDLV